ncbi:HAMP domain-containing sensor histidine kinase [Paenibacillus radicis (ex Gao et al. 2016)]|uniref:histidine kinase n=1 Tax=Paenibacillus radicis (ex Gao et al. 2016) TaxID=1737354 RepID=A0A917HJ10_9BACL|nr:HAMP domain-containing sensor histidine kinase [Paenibacillus radicis (ex Gao et al. 2016)]GGG80918.1 hypothetical protein GCM10010918_42630 [Paenibacillus radicis (ex Gao et al. 2016)]
MKRLFSIRRRWRLHTSLIFDFFFFNIFLMVIIIVCFIAGIIYAFQNAHTSESMNASAASFLKSDKRSAYSIQWLEKHGGWLEELDDKFHVIGSKGKKGNEKIGYTQDELFALLENGEKQTYYYSIAAIESYSPPHYLVMKIPREQISIQKNMAAEPLVIDEEQPFPFNRVKIFFYGSIAAVLFFIFLYSYWVARRIKKPLDTVAAGLKRMTHGDYSTRIDVHAEKEFKQISDTFNYMASVIESTAKEKRLLEESKERLIVDLSHDLKTPITSIQGFSQALMEGKVEDSDRQNRYLNYIYNKSNQVTALIESMLELLKLDSPDHPLKLEKSDVGDFLRESVAEMYGDIERKNFELAMEIPDRSMVAVFNAEALNRIITNLLANALKYNPPGTKLRVAIKEEAVDVRIEIGDSGIGIPEHLKLKLFDPFVRGDESRSNENEGGLGLGLSIAKKLAEKMGGSLYLEDSQEDSTLFVISLTKK